jgi:hypothetical protein
MSGVTDQWCERVPGFPQPGNSGVDAPAVRAQVGIVEFVPGRR